MTEGTSTSGATAAAETVVPADAVAAFAVAASSPATAPVDAQSVALATAAAMAAAPSVPAVPPAAPAVGPTAIAIAAAEAAAAVEAAAAKKADKAEKDSDSDETSMSDAELLPEVELASLGEAGAATAGQAGLPCGVLPVVDAPVVSGPPLVDVPVGDSGFAFSPVLLGLLGLGALGLGYLLLRNDDDDDEEVIPPPPPPPPPPANVAPTAADEVVAVDEDATVTGQLDATDSDGTIASFALTAPVAGLTVNADGSFTFDASNAAYDELAEGETQTVTATFTVTDDDGATDTGTITITINGVNAAPAADDVTVNADEDGAPVTGAVVATDVDGDDLTFTLDEPVEGLTLNADGTFTFDPTVNPDFQGLAEGEQQTIVANVTVTDENGDTDTSTITIIVTGVNDAPVITAPATVTVDENIPEQTVVFDADATDADGEDVTFSISGVDAAFFDIDPLTGEVRFIGSPDFETRSSFTITVTAADASGAEDSQQVVINIRDVVETPVNTAPVLTAPATANVNENAPGAVVLDASATDAEGDTITFSLEGPDRNFFTINAQTGVVTIIQGADFETRPNFNITVVATDEDGLRDTQDVIVSVNDVDENVNGAPVITVDNAVDIDENEPAGTVVVDADATDPDGDDVTFSISGEDAALFNIDPLTGEVRLRQSADFETDPGPFNIIITATDADGLSDSEAVTVTINDVDDPAGPTVVFLDNEDDDNNPNTEATFDASGDSFIFLEDQDEGSLTIITGFTADDTLVFEEGSEVSFGTSVDDPNDLQIIVNNNGVVSEVILDDVLADDAGLIFDEATAEAEVGFNFFSETAMVDANAMTADSNFA